MPDFNSSLFRQDLHFQASKHLPLTPYSLPIAIWDLIEANWAHKGVSFTQEYPREPVTTPIIVWSIYRKVGGRDGLEINKPRLRGSFSDDTDPTITYDQYAQWMTTIYQFDIYHINNESANELTEEFENLMFHVTPILKELGTSEWLFDEQLRDVELNRPESQEIYRRTLRYRCILERKFIKPVQNILSVWIQMGLETGLRQDNERVLRNSNIAKDRLSKDWVSKIWRITKEYQIDITTMYTSGSQYLEGVDYKVVLSAPDGASYIEWLPRGKHPMPGEEYYITYLYRNIDMKFPANRPPNALN